MFTIYQTNIGGRVSRRYFRTWTVAKIAIDNEIQEYKKLNWDIAERSNRMNGDKGFTILLTSAKLDRTPPGAEQVRVKSFLPRL